MRKCLLLACIGFQLFAHAQNPGDLPSIIPPSPEVSSLVAAGRTSTGMFTGSANANIPLYEIKVGSLSLPIALSYSTNGTRVNDIPSRVGLGWNLVAGGSVSRVVHDEEDENILTTRLTPPDFVNDIEGVFQFALYATIENYDTERDEYSFSVNGLSGKFYFDDNGEIRFGDHSKVKIYKEGDAFILINTNGVKYEFGKNSVIEKTRDVKTNGVARANKIKKTAWFLTKIVSPEGDEIAFTYAPIYFKTNLGPNQSVILKTTSGSFPNAPNAGCATFCEEQWSPVQFSKVDYDSYYLTRIQTSNGLDAYFAYADRPDASGDNRLIQLNVFSSNGYDQPKAICKFLFQYDDYTVGVDLNQRFYLRKVIQVTNETTPQTIAHEFFYNNPGLLPSQESMGQDYYGYYNGVNTNQNFFPRPYNYMNYFNGSLGAVRDPDHTTTAYGTLQKIIYPTGGYEEFEYEPHTVVGYPAPGSTTFNSSLSFNGVTGAGGSGAWDACDPQTYTQQFTGGYCEVSFQTMHNISGPPLGSVGACTPDSIHFIAYLEIWDLTLNTRVFEARHRYYHSETIPVILGNSNYEVRLIVKGLSTKCFVTVQYDPAAGTPFINEPSCGLRVKSLKSFDQVAGKSHFKHYKYVFPEMLTKTSGIGFSKPDFTSDYWGGGYCVTGSNGGHFPYICGDGIGLLQVSSTALNRKSSFNGSPVAYSHVIEADDLNMLNGGTIHQFVAIHNDVVPTVLHNQMLSSYMTSDVSPDINGTEWRTANFKLIAGTIKIVRDVRHMYAFDTRISSSETNYVVRKRFEPGASSAYSAKDRMRSFDIGSYEYKSKWWRLASTINTDYDEEGNNPVTNTTYYTHNNLAHLQPTDIQTSNSKGETITETLKYPHDYAISPYTEMVGMNMLNNVIESVRKNSNVQVSATKTDYSFFGSLIQPQYVKAISGTGQLENRLQFAVYNTRGQVSEVSKINDVPVSYLYNYLSSRPVAEVKNGKYAEIAYTSFEADDDGRWTISGTKYNGGVTGFKYFTGTLSRTISNTSIPYVVTAWVQGNMTVNGVSGTLIVTKGTWKLYRWSIGAGTGSVSVSGTAIDEVRLHPEAATMTTFTHNAFLGVNATCDANNKITYYEYDGFSRLRLVLDQDRNVIERFCYNYAGQNENCSAGTNGCSNTLPNWQNTSQTRCQLNSIGQNTGYIEYEQKDMNTCSPSYLQTQWLQGSYDPEACTVVEDVTVTSYNPNGLSGFVATYTNTVTNVVTQFNIPTATSIQTLGTLPEGNYTLVISNPNNNILLLFGSGCTFQDGITSVTFYNVNIASCNDISIEWNL